MAAALDAAGASLGALGMMAFAVVFWTVVQSSIATAFIGASLAWLMVSVAAWYGRRQMRRGGVRFRDKAAAPRSRSRQDRCPRQAAVEAFALTPLRSATVLSLVFAAFSSLRLVVRKRTISS